MERLRKDFEQNLKTKLQERCTSHMSEETYLFKAFRFFDMDNSGTVTQNEWIRAIEKIGIQLYEPRTLDSLFKLYDSDGNGYLDYEEFTAMVFGAESGTRRRLSPRKVIEPSLEVRVGEILRDLREKISSRGIKGIIGLYRQFSLIDYEESGLIRKEEFFKSIRDYRLSLTDEEAESLGEYFEEEAQIIYSEFIRALKGSLSPSRRGLIAKSFQKLDNNNTGVVSIQVIRNEYNSDLHPDVKNYRKSSEEILNEFLDTFELHHSLIGKRGNSVEYQEFEEFFSAVSATISSDKYFELIMNNVWDLQQPAPFKEPPLYFNTIEFPIPPSSSNIEDLLKKFRQKLAVRGVRGFLGLIRQFRLMDDENSSFIHLSELIQGVREYRIDISDRELREIFSAFDPNETGRISQKSLLDGIIGKTNPYRTGLIHQAWNKLDTYRTGFISLESIRENFSPAEHPDIRAGKKNKEEVLNDFLESFELHHMLNYNSSSNYYETVSASIEDDVYFENMMSNTWRLKNEPPAREAWKGDWNRQLLDHKASWLADHHRGHFTGSVTQSAPFGTNDEPVDYSTALRSRKPEQDLLSLSTRIPPAGMTTWPVRK